MQLAKAAGVGERTGPGREDVPKGLRSLGSVRQPWEHGTSVFNDEEFQRGSHGALREALGPRGPVAEGQTGGCGLSRPGQGKGLRVQRPRGQGRLGFLLLSLCLFSEALSELAG